MNVYKVGPDEDLTIPGQVLQTAGIKANDVAYFRAKGDGIIEVKALSAMSIDDFIAIYGYADPIVDWNKEREEAEAEQGDLVIEEILRGYE
jgi:bifunctional DNA-binding transcriptional regulator/antitoxin component of YhaV-PrlF toxin-antitoxin module